LWPTRVETQGVRSFVLTEEKLLNYLIYLIWECPTDC
jgi:hypothetical protein